MRLVMDLLFLEELDFRVDEATGRRCMAVAQSIEESFRMALETIGIELDSYGTVQFVPVKGGFIVQGRSKAWREKAERKTQSR